jgi:Fe-S cluster assembly ATP-binding protein
MALLKMDPSFMNRAVNEGILRRREEAQRSFSDGGHESRPRTDGRDDSGLDIDALKIVSQGANSLAAPSAAITDRHALPSGC